MDEFNETLSHSDKGSQQINNQGSAEWFYRLIVSNWNLLNEWWVHLVPWSLKK